MLWKASAIREYKLLASDGEIGAVKDVLFDDRTWTARWLVVDTGLWLFGRKVLLPVSALGKSGLLAATLAAVEPSRSAKSLRLVRGQHHGSISSARRRRAKKTARHRLWDALAAA